MAMSTEVVEFMSVSYAIFFTDLFIVMFADFFCF